MFCGAWCNCSDVSLANLSALLPYNPLVPSRTFVPCLGQSHHIHSGHIQLNFWNAPRIHFFFPYHLCPCHITPVTTHCSWSVAEASWFLPFGLSNQMRALVTTAIAPSFTAHCPFAFDCRIPAWLASLVFLITSSVMFSSAPSSSWRKRIFFPASSRLLLAPCPCERLLLAVQSHQHPLFPSLMCLLVLTLPAVAYAYSSRLSPARI